MSDDWVTPEEDDWITPGAAPRGQPQQTLRRQLGLTARHVIEGVVDSLRDPAAAVLNAPSAIINDVAGRTVIPEPFSYGAARGWADSLGLPSPETGTERIVGAASRGAAGMVLPFVGGRGALRANPVAPGAVQSPGQAVAGALADSPGIDAFAGATGGAAQGLVEEAGGGAAAGFGANLGGSIAGTLVGSLIIAIAGRRGVRPGAVRPDSITPDEVAAVWSDPDVRRIAEANGITDPADPRVGLLQPRVEQRRAVEAAPDGAARGQNAQRGVPNPEDMVGDPGVNAEVLRERRIAERAAERPAMPPEQVPQPPGPMAVTPEGQAFPDDAGTRASREAREGYGPNNGALVPTEPQVQRMTPGDIARARAAMEGGNQNLAEPPPRLVAPEGRLPQTPDQAQAQRQAAEAFDGAERQRSRVGGDVRDTQAAGRPEGVNPQTVLLDQGFPVRVIGRDDRGFVSVERYDPRTGAADPEAVPYVVRERTLEQRQYAAAPRQAQDFTARSGSPRNPEAPRDAGPGQPAQEPRQSFRATTPDPNTDFPGATRPGPAEGQPPPGRSPIPDQPEGPAPGRRWSSAEEAERAFQQRRAQAEADAQQARDRGEWTSGQRSTNTPAGQDTDGRWRVGDGGYVASDAGGPIRFGDQKQAARWIISRGQKDSPDQFFDIAVHPSGQGFTVREAGRNAGSSGQAGAGSRPDAGGSAAAPGAGQRGADAQTPSGGPRADQGGEPQRIAGPKGARVMAGAEPGAEMTPKGPLRPNAQDAPGGAQRAAAFARAAPKAEADNIPSTPSSPDVSTPRPEGNGNPTLYSNPLDPAAVKRFLADPLVAGARTLRNALLESTAARTVGDTVRYLAASNRAVLRTIADRYPKVAELREIADMLATDPGTGRRVTETYQTAADSTAVSYINRLGNMLGRDADVKVDGRIRDILTGTLRGAAPEETAKAAQVRRLLDEFHGYLKRAGLDLGYVKGKYFPRMYDAEKALADSDGFLRDATALYRKMGLGAGDARDAAQDWLNRLAGVGRGPAEFGHTPVSTKFTKGRELPSAADDIMRAWMVADPREALQSYFLRGTRAAEYTSRFGRNGEKLEEMLTAAFEQGVPSKDLRFLRRAIESSTGTMSGSASGPGHAITGWVQTIGPLAVLPRAVLSSLVEGMTIGSRTGNLWRGIEGFGESWKAVLRTKDTAEARQVAELLGVISDGLTDMRAAAVWDAGVDSKAQRALVGGLFRVTGMQEITNGQRIAAVKVGQTFIRQMADEVAQGAGTKASATRLLSELGVDEGQARALSAWLKRNDGTPKATDLLGDTSEAVSYRTAVRRFVQESIQNPEAVDKPALAGHAVGRMAYGITSFMFAFTRNVLLRSAKEAGAALNPANDFTLQDRARLLGPLVGYFALASAQFGVSQAREALFNWHQTDQRDPWVKTILNMDRTGAFGNFSPLVNMVSAAKYERDPSSILTGPYLAHYLTNIGKMTLGLVPQPVGPNSPNTNNAGHAAVRAFHAAVLAPAISAAAAMAPGGAALQAAYGIGTMFATSRGAGSEMATALVGERTVQPRTGGRAAQPGGAIQGGGAIRGGGGAIQGGGAIR